MYDTNTLKMKKQFTRFKDIAYAGCFRCDGKLLAAGGESQMVQVFDVEHKTVLRQLKGHTGAVRAVQFSSNKVSVASGSDDATMRLWDVATGSETARLEGHADYVRAIAGSPAGEEIWATGGYDHSCRVWDVRSSQCVMQFDHGAPIEDLAWFPSAGLLATAGGPMVCVWDVLSGRRLHRLTNHQKTVMCVRVVADIGPPTQGEYQGQTAATRMFTGSLDGHLKVYDCDKFKVTHVSKYPGPITSMGIAPDCSTLAVGTANGMLSIRKRAKPRAKLGIDADGKSLVTRGRRNKEPRMQTGTYKYFMRGQSTKAGVGDFKVAAQRKANLAQFDRKLRSFRLGEALDAALSTHMPEVIVSVVEELIQRGGLQSAISGRHAESLVPILDFLIKYVTEPRYSQLLVGVTECMLDVYGSVIGQSQKVDKKLQILQERILVEARLHRELLMLQGSLEPILTAAMD